MKVFVSHGHNDTWIAQQLAHNISRAGAKPWLDVYDVLTGDDFEARMRHALEQTDEVPALITSVTTRRTWLFQEVGAAWILHKRVSALLYGISIEELDKDDGAGLLNHRLVRNLNDAAAYFDELKGRCRHVS